MRSPARRRVLRPLVVTLLLLVVVSLSADRAGGTGPVPSLPPRQRIILIGLDAADWLAIDPMIEAGALPALARLKGGGHIATMVSTPPLVSPILWTTIATGLPPDRHGVLDFMVDLPGGGQTPVRSSDRRGPALWNLFDEAGRTVAVIGWWATWPAEHLHGTVVTDAVAPQLATKAAQLDTAMVWPESALRRTAASVVAVSQLTYQDLSAYVPLSHEEFARALRDADSSSAAYDNPLAHLATIVASSRTYSALAVAAMKADQPDFLAVYFEAVDSVSHLFVRDPVRGRRAIERTYRDADDLIRRLAEASPSDTLLVVCSDHGFYPRTAAIREDPRNLRGAATAWHRPYGIAAVATADAVLATARPGIGTPAMASTMSPIDVAPTVLHAAGLPVTMDMVGRVVTELLPPAAAARSVQRVAAKPERPAAPSSSNARRADGERARLQSLGYVASAGPTSSLARQNLGEVLYRRGDFPRAERELRRVIEAQPANVTATLWLAKTLVAQAKPAEALDVYERAMSLPGGAREALVEAATLAIGAGRQDRVEALIGAATQAADAASAVAIARGDLDEAAGHHAAAERAYRRALQIDPVSFDASARLLDQLGRTNRAVDAVPVIEGVVRIAPDSPRHLALLGEARLRAGDAAGAERALARALQLVPDGTAVRLALARAQLMQRKSVEAVAILDGTTPSGERQALLGAAFAAQKKWEDAVRALDDAMRLGMATPEVMNQLGWALIQLGARDRARIVLGQSLAQKPDQADIRTLLKTLDSPSRSITR